ncbi:unnamed protein product, partial [Didymodactylos carnosus]
KGTLQWGCGIRPEMIPDKDNPGYWISTTYCPKHIHLAKNTIHQLKPQPSTLISDDYGSIVM